ncbi:DHA2 family efflux MFS transporter permease subunit [Nonomuraea sp. NEAU-A123]|uniref:DHA2 family efflux MFS transporter permease subunit n=1 Tax=Nonomuraea sp. NEAU-A123 TaxID=2839649 RepID=UPI001BE3F22B|nr:DHA2 family efflux MFS transporter permease subunit [Nonomuraea sp. NEAU-A123]MBT2227697.1 DHA2 family efflux MFS transporter permease subunit [Nonomuraea sp. NEAU-A123]
MAHAPHLAHSPDQAEATDPRRWPALVLLCVAQFMLILDVTVINVALPSIGADLHLDRVPLTWAVTSYTLCFGGLMLLGGRLGDTFGARRILLTGLIVFVLASLVTGLATGGPMLIGGRLAQGVGAALLSPSALATLTRTFHGAERNKALGIWAALGGVGFAVGAILGGVLAAGPGWRWVFFINVPVGLAVLAWLPRVVAADRPQVRRRVDLPGAVLVTGATAALIYGLVNAGEAGWGSLATLGALAGAVVGYAAFALVERAVQEPLMDVRILARRPVATGAFLMLIGTALLLGSVFLGSLYLQRVQGQSALTAGILFLPVAVGTAVTGHLAGRLIGHLGARVSAVGGLLVAGAGAVVLALSEGTAGIVIGLTIGAAGVVLVFVAATTTALGFVAHHEAGLASGVVNTFHEVGGSIGTAVVSTIAAVGIEHASTAGFTAAYTACAIAAGAAAIIALVLVPRGKAQVPAGVHAH